MSNSLPKAYLTRLMVPAVLDRMRPLCDVQINPVDDTVPRDELLREVSDAVILMPNGPDSIDGELLEAAKELKLIANFGVGYNNIDVDTAGKLGIPVTNTPGVLSDATADIAWGLLMNVARRIGEGERMIRADAWPGWGPLQLLGGDVTGATLGLLGLGNIGKAMIPRAKGFAMDVIYWNRTRLDPSGRGGAWYSLRNEGGSPARSGLCVFARGPGSGDAAFDRRGRAGAHETDGVPD